MSRVVAFWSPSGAGATTLVLNAATALGARGLGVAAVDLNLTAPSLALYADLLPYDQPGEACLSRVLPALHGGRLTQAELSRHLLAGPGFSLLPGMLDLLSSSRLTEGDIRQLIRMLAARTDVVLVDTAAPLDSLGCLPVLELADLVVLVVGPEIASRFHTRRSVMPLLGAGWGPRLALVHNRSDGKSVAQVAGDVGIPVAAEVPDLRLMPGLVQAGEIAYAIRTVLPAMARFRSAVDVLAALVWKGV